MNIKELCYGCLHHCKFFEVFNQGNNNISRLMIKCPCRECVVKVKCNTKCKERKKFYYEESNDRAREDHHIVWYYDFLH